MTQFCRALLAPARAIRCRLPPPSTSTLTHHTAPEAADLLDDLGVVYADAYADALDSEKIQAFRNRATKALERLRYGLLTARDDEQLVGFIFGYALLAGSSWWDGLSPAPAAGFLDEDGTRTFALAEIEVRAAGSAKASAGPCMTRCSTPGKRNEQRWPPVPRPILSGRSMSGGAGRRWAPSRVRTPRTSLRTPLCPAVAAWGIAAQQLIQLPDRLAPLPGGQPRPEFAQALVDTLRSVRRGEGDDAAERVA